jgi:hypothetical protein
MMPVAIGWQIQDVAGLFGAVPAVLIGARGNDRYCATLDAIVSGFAGNQLAGRMRRFS